MIYEDIEFLIRAGLGRNEWTLLIYYPDNLGGNPSVLQFSGSRDDAIASARQRIHREPKSAIRFLIAWAAE